MSNRRARADVALLSGGALEFADTDDVHQGRASQPTQRLVELNLDGLREYTTVQVVYVAL